VRDLTQLEIYINVRAELQYLLSLSPSSGGIRLGEDLFFAYDLRPSSTELVESEGGRGKLCQAVQRAIEDSGMKAVNLGAIPTPALAYYSLGQHKAGIMVTGSHIPFDRNGYKLYTSQGELLKQDEGPVGTIVHLVRDETYSQSFSNSSFNERGMFKTESGLSPIVDVARSAYITRYLELFRSAAWTGRRIVVYEHSAVGRGILTDILDQLGAEVIPVGRSETFVPIDTENINREQVDLITALCKPIAAEGKSIDAIVSTDGDGDRPLLFAWDPVAQTPRFFSGDLLGMVTAEYLRADAIVVPITCNDGIDRGPLRHLLEPKTRIGSPFVIAGMENARRKGRLRICGWEANGGFLTGTDMSCNGVSLTALPTRDALLPLLAVLSVAHERRQSLSELLDTVSTRYSRSTLLREFPKEVSTRIVSQFSPSSVTIRSVVFTGEMVDAFDERGSEVQLSVSDRTQLVAIKDGLSNVFSPALGFGTLTSLNYTDGVRARFSNGDIAHFRPSGNADEFRIYSAADTQSRADEICSLSVAQPNGALLRLQSDVPISLA
jgi:phosphomannomutase